MKTKQMLCGKTGHDILMVKEKRGKVQNLYPNGQ